MPDPGAGRWWPGSLGGWADSGTARHRTSDNGVRDATNKANKAQRNAQRPTQHNATQRTLRTSAGIVAYWVTQTCGSEIAIPGRSDGTWEY
ncbi:unnamed protein product [Cutaneotrichosporon oleaginosum]